MDLRKRLTNAVRSALELEIAPEMVWQVPKRADQGDLSTNVAMLLAKELKMAPRQIAEKLVTDVNWSDYGIDRVEVAGPGFLNLFLGTGYYQSVVRQILTEQGGFGQSTSGQGQDYIVEFVSANPTGPLNVVSARAAAIGDSLVRLLRKAGYKAFAEFYVNDAGRQIQRLGASVIALSRGEKVPDDGYHGEYVAELAKQIFSDGPAVDDADPETVGKRAAELNVEHQREVLNSYGVEFDRWYHESELHAGGAPEHALEFRQAEEKVYGFPIDRGCA
jgi:arginyl-tRNA synthetase